MQNDYLGFLDQRAAQRRLAAKFAHPRLLLLHTIAFVGVVTVLFAAFIPWLRWIPQRALFENPALILFGWSILLAGHALLHYRRSAAISEPRELVVEDEMRQFIEKNDEPVTDRDLFAMHQNLGGSLERQGWLSQGLAVFAFVNVASWLGSAINAGTSWGYQLALPTALVLVGGVYAFRLWQHSRKIGQENWVTRLPLYHLLAYGVGTFLLALFGMLRMVDALHVDTLVGWWTLAVLLHVVLAVVALPLFRRLAPEALQSRLPAKRKPEARLVLSDDGEMLEIVDSEASLSRVNRS